MQRVVAICESTGVPFRTVPLRATSCRPVAAGPAEVAIEGSAGPQADHAGLEPDPRLVGWAHCDGRRRWFDRLGALSPVRAARCRSHHPAGDQRAAADHRGRAAAQLPDVEIEAVLGDCGDPAVIRHALSLHPVDTAFHAAAYKHVPVLERQLREAVRNNILATESRPRVPGSPRGAFRVHFHGQGGRPGQCAGCEQALRRDDLPGLDQKSTHTRFVTVRFGNVLASAGSVVPLFRSRSCAVVRSRHGPGSQPLLHDHPEACQLILQAAGVAWCDLHSGHGRAGADPRAGRTDDPFDRQAAVQDIRSSIPACARARSCTRRCSIRTKTTVRPRTRRFSRPACVRSRAPGAGQRSAPA